MNRERQRRRTAAEKRGLQFIGGVRAAKPVPGQNRAYTLRRPLLRPSDILGPPQVQEVLTRASRFMYVVEQLSVSLLHPEQVEFMAKMASNEIELKKSLKAAAKELPDYLNCSAGRVSIMGATHTQSNNKYVAYRLDDESTALVQNDQVAVLEAFGTKRTRTLNAHISLFYTPNLELAEDIAARLEDASSFPIPVLLGAAQVFLTRYAERE